MKKFAKILPFIAIGVLILGTLSCTKDDEETCDNYPVEQCTMDDVTICSDDDGTTYYVYQGKRYNDVDDLAQVCGATSAEAFGQMTLQIDNFTQQLLMDAKTAADCL
nr:hypothetical protein [uncultured Carboxylicivirga sp.]